MTTHAWGFGLATVTTAGDVLDVWYPVPALGSRPDDAKAPAELVAAEGNDDLRQVRREAVATEIALDDAPSGTADAYLRLHLLSHRLVRPPGVNLDGIFAALPNHACTSLGPVPVDETQTV